MNAGSQVTLNCSPALYVSTFMVHPKQPIERQKVMLIDDSAIVLAVAQCTLETAGYEVVTHLCPTGCLAVILQESPDLLLIDVNMPGINGDTLVKMINAAQVNQHMIIILYSTLEDHILAQKVQFSHAHGYIRKTDSPQNFLRQVARWLQPSTQRLAKVGCENHPVSKVLLVASEMAELSELRRLLTSQPNLEFALSGKEALRRIQGGDPPSAVVLGKLSGSPTCEEVIHEAIRLHPQWRNRFIPVHNGSRPTAAMLHEAIDKIST